MLFPETPTGFNMVVFNRNGVATHLFFLISTLIFSIAVVFAVNLKANLKESTAELKLTEIKDFHSMDYVPLELGKNLITHQGKAVNNKIAVDDVDKNNQTTFIEDAAKLALINNNVTKTVAKNKALASKVIRISNFPVKDGLLSSGFGMRKHPIHGYVRMHSGIDIAAASGTKVQAMGEGTVVFAGRKSGYGNNIEVKHGNSVLTRYSHLKEILVEVGQQVTPADVIGLVGNTGVSTGPHLHLEVALNETEVDPTIFLAGKATVESKPVVRRLTKVSTKPKLKTNFGEVTYQDYLQNFGGLYGLVAPGRTN